jgi:transcriptional regulator with XRE-family HTH domain
MFAVHELSHSVRTRRKEIGMSQAALAQLAGVSRSTIVQLENATLKDLSFSRTAAVLNAIGLNLVIWPAHPHIGPRSPEYTPPLDIAARTASTSYRTAINSEVLSSVLYAGVVPEDYQAHVHTLLDEAPLALLARVVEQMHAETGMPRDQVWSNMRRLATKAKLRRAIWQD